VEPHELLSRYSLLEKMPGADLAAIAAIATRERYEDTALVCRAGDDADALYVVERGTIEVVRDGRVVGTLESGQGFGEGPFFAPGKRVLDARAIGGAQLLCLRYDRLRALFAERPAVELAFYRSACADVFARLRQLAST